MATDRTDEGCWRFNTESLKWEKQSWWKQNRNCFLIQMLLLMCIVVLAVYEREPKIEYVDKIVNNTIIIPDSSHTVKRVVHDDLVNAMIHVESRGRDSIVNKTSGATGCLQLLPIMVREVNNILKRTGNNTKFSLEDRIDRNKSVAMFHIWRIYHHSGDSYEVISRCWNGGPNGYLIPETIGYWNSVKKQIPGWEKCKII